MGPWLVMRQVVSCRLPDTCMCKPMRFMVSIWVVLGVVVGPVICSRIPVVTELVLGSMAPKPPYLHIHHFAPAGNNCVVGHPNSCGVIRLDVDFWFGPAHVNQGLAMRYHLLCRYEECSQFSFRCRRHDEFDYLGNGEDSTVESRVRVIFQEEDVSPCAAA